MSQWLKSQWFHRLALIKKGKHSKAWLVKLCYCTAASFSHITYTLAADIKAPIFFIFASTISKKAVGNLRLPRSFNCIGPLPLPRFFKNDAILLSSFPFQLVTRWHWIGWSHVVRGRIRDDSCVSRRQILSSRQGSRTVLSRVQRDFIDAVSFMLLAVLRSDSGPLPLFWHWRGFSSALPSLFTRVFIQFGLTRTWHWIRNLWQRSHRRWPTEGATVEKSWSSREFDHRLGDALLLQ